MDIGRIRDALLVVQVKPCAQAAEIRPSCRNRPAYALSLLHIRRCRRSPPPPPPPPPARPRNPPPPAPPPPRGGPARRIRLDAAAEGEVLRRSRPRLRFAKKVSAALVEEAVSSLALAKAMHDDLEAVYNPHVDFELVDKTAQDIWEEILTF